MPVSLDAPHIRLPLLPESLTSLEEASTVIRSAHRAIFQERDPSQPLSSDQIREIRTFTRALQEKSRSLTTDLSSASVRTFLQQLQELEEETTRPETVLRFEGKEIQVFKTLLTQNSFFFAALFDPSSRFAEGTGQAEVSLTCPELLQELSQKEKQDLFEQLLHFLYTGKVSLTKENVLPLLVMADAYGVVALKQRCEHILALHITLENAEEIQKQLGSCSVAIEQQCCRLLGQEVPACEVEPVASFSFQALFEEAQRASHSSDPTLYSIHVGGESIDVHPHLLRQLAPKFTYQLLNHQLTVHSPEEIKKLIHFLYHSPAIASVLLEELPIAQVLNPSQISFTEMQDLLERHEELAYQLIPFFNKEIIKSSQTGTRAFSQTLLQSCWGGSDPIQFRETWIALLKYGEANISSIRLLLETCEHFIHFPWQDRQRILKQSIYALGWIQTLEGLEALLNFLNKIPGLSHETASLFAQSIGKIGLALEKDSIAVLTSRLAPEASELTQVIVLEALGVIAAAKEEPEAVDSLIDSLKSPRSTVKQAAVRGLVKAQGNFPAIGQAFFRQLTRSESLPFGKITILKALKGETIAESPALLGCVKKFLSDREPQNELLVETAIDFLKGTKNALPPEIIDELQRLASSSKVKIAADATSLLIKLGLPVDEGIFELLSSRLLTSSLRTEVKLAVIEALTDGGKSIDEEMQRWVYGWRGSADDDRGLFIEADTRLDTCLASHRILGKMAIKGQETAVEELSARLADPKIDLALLTAALKEVGVHTHAPLIAKLIEQEPTPRIALALQSLLTGESIDAFVSLLLPLLDHPDLQVRTPIYQLLTQSRWDKNHQDAILKRVVPHLGETPAAFALIGKISSQTDPETARILLDAVLDQPLSVESVRALRHFDTYLDTPTLTALLDRAFSTPDISEALCELSHTLLSLQPRHWPSSLWQKIAFYVASQPQTLSDRWIALLHKIAHES